MDGFQHHQQQQPQQQQFPAHMNPALLQQQQQQKFLQQQQQQQQQRPGSRGPGQFDMGGLGGMGMNMGMGIGGGGGGMNMGGMGNMGLGIGGGGMGMGGGGGGGGGMNFDFGSMNMGQGLGMGGMGLGGGGGMNMGMGNMGGGGMGGNMGGGNMGSGGMGANMGAMGGSGGGGGGLALTPAQIAQLQAQGATPQQVQAMQARLVAQAMAARNQNQSRAQFHPEHSPVSQGPPQHTSPQTPSHPQTPFINHQQPLHHTPQLHHQQQQQHTPQPPAFAQPPLFDRERPPSATPAHAQMRPPPPPRPPSARPGTGHSHRSVRTPTPTPEARKRTPAPGLLGGAGGGLMGPPHVVPARDEKDAKDKNKDREGSRDKEVGKEKEGEKEKEMIGVEEKPLPPLGAEDAARVAAWAGRDRAYEGLYKAMRARVGEEARRVGMGAGAWWEVPGEARRVQGHGRAKFGVTYPGQRLREMGRRRGRREGFRLPRSVDPEEAARAETLVPIRLELDVEHQKMRDTFVWNLNDPVITPEVFAQSVVDDYQLAPGYHGTIVKAIQEQLSDFRAHMLADGDGAEADDERGGVGAGTGRLEEGAEEAAWWEEWRRRVEDGKKRRRGAGGGRKRRKVEVKEEDVFGPGAAVVPEALDASMDWDDKEFPEEMRIVIKLDIIVGSLKLEDQFEWDIENIDASPEQFAEVYTRDLGLGGEFKTAIAHAIREQVQTYQKSLFLVGHPSDGTAVQDDDLRMAFLSPVHTGARALDQVLAFTPQLGYLSDSEIERNEKEREKELTRRRKRNTRGRRGVALPDREPAKTYRTPAIGFPDVDPAVLALQQAAAAPTSRRAAAAAASLTIANMVASENGTAVVTPQPMATPTPAPQAAKEKKPKGLFRAPPVPPAVLRARAGVQAPTPSTAVDAALLPPPLENDPPAPMPTVAPPDSRATRVISAKRAKELEREAKEKGFADGQHANMIDGVWHCSNCGCPEDIAIGRRKGPLGDKSQCGTCGKFWHRHRRPRPVVYNSDHDFHLNQRNEAEKAKSASKKKGGAAAARAGQTPAAEAEAEDPPPPEPATPVRAWADAPRRSPGSDGGSSSASEPPLAQRMSMKANGAGKADSAPPAAQGSPLPTPSSPVQNASASAPPGPEGSMSPVQAAQQRTPPPWLTAAWEDCLTKYPDDKVEFRYTTTGNPPNWRIRCLDCPGKLYMPGPGETFNNFDVHLRNRQHRSKVNERVAREAAEAADS